MRRKCVQVVGRIVIAGAALGCVLVTGCEKLQEPVQPASATPTVAVSFYPLEYFASRLASTDAVVLNPLPDDVDPITVVPSDAALGAFQAADLIAINGAGFEKWVSQAALPRSRVVDTTKSLVGALIEYESALTHSHGPEGGHAHEGVDGHTWLDPVNAMAQADAIRSALVRKLPAQKDAIDARFSALRADLEVLDEAFTEVSAAIERGGWIVLASHPAYNYVSRRYGWQVVNFDIDPNGSVLNESVRQRLLELQRVQLDRRAIMLFESAPGEALVEALGALGVVTIEFSPVESRPDAPADFVSVMQENIARLGTAVGKAE